MEKALKYNLCWEALSHATDIIRTLFSERGGDWEDQEVRSHFYDILDQAVWFGDMEEKLKEKEKEK